MVSAHPHVVDFQESSHTLSVSGRVLPSVTTILSGAGMIKGEEFFQQEAAYRGSAVHMICELDDLGDLDEDQQIVQQHCGYLEAARKFKKDSGFDPRVIERPLADVSLGFAGIPDRFGFSAWPPKPTVVDWKTGAIGKHVGLQLAAYVHLACVNDLEGMAGPAYKAPSLWRRIAVRLQADGKYNVKEFDNPKDWQVFSAALCVENWKRTV